MKKKAGLLIFVWLFCIFIFCLSAQAKQEVFNNEIFLMEYDSSHFTVDVLETGNLKINSVVNLDDGGGGIILF